MNMFHIHLLKRRAGVTATAAGLCLILGCGDDTGLAKRYSVSGTVTYHDAPLEKGQITFIPTDRTKQREAAGTIEGGRYTLTTATAGDGALPGEYGVTITSLEVDSSKVVETVTTKGGGGRQHEIGQATAKGKSLIPAKYRLAETGQLKATVEERSNTINFKLTDD
jgi:hypothetical protein